MEASVANWAGWKLPLGAHSWIVFQAIQSPNATKLQSFQPVNRPPPGDPPRAAIGLCVRQKWHKTASLKTGSERAAGPPAGCGRDSPVLSGEKRAEFRRI